MALAVALLISGKKTCYSYIGTRTMAIYLFHGLVYSTIKGCSGILSDVHSPAESMLLILFCVILVGVLSIPQLSTMTAAISNINPSLFYVPYQDPFYYSRYWWVFH